MAEVHKTPGIYTFLGLATLPRLRSPSNNLRHLPREIIQRIARFAHREHYFACFPLLGGAFADDDDSYPDVVVSCATRPVPPSLLVAANQPKYASEYYAAGAFEDAGPV